MTLRAAVKHGAVIAGLALCPALAILADSPVWLVACLAALPLLGLHVIVQRRGGWRLLGPHFYFDLIRMSRKGRTALFRTLFLVLVMGGIWTAYEKHQEDLERASLGEIELLEDVRRDRRNHGPRLQEDFRAVPNVRNALARFNADCIYRWFLLQNIAILVLVPAYVGGAIAEERERGTLDLLFASALYDREILLGKLAARVVHLGGLLLAGLPIFSMMLVFGGVDMQLLLENWVNSALLLLAASSICLMISTVPMR
jgi:hypothetical protein